MDFQFFSCCIQVAHAHVHLEDFGKPVEVGGLTVHPGDLIHADQHGVCVIPQEMAPELAEACREYESLEQPLIQLAHSPEFTPAAYAAARAVMQQKRADLTQQWSGRA